MKHINIHLLDVLDIILALSLSNQILFRMIKNDFKRYYYVTFLIF